MDSLETVSCIVDDFLNFSPDLDDPSPKEDGSSPQEDEITYQKSPQNLCFGSQTNTHQAQLDILDRYTDSFPAVGEEELEWLLNENAFPPFEPFSTPFQSPKHQSPVSVLESGVGGSGFRVPGRPRSQRKRRRQFAVVGIFGMLGGEKRRRCLHCLAEKTPQWRAGPLGPKTLCNACGVRFKAGRLVPEYRPASSPTFSSELHSNSHRKILEMRRKKQKTAPENG